MKDLTVGKEGPLILKFAIPMLLGNVFQQLYNVVDSIIVGNYIGKEALSAVGASFPLIFVLISLLIGFGSGISIIISQYFGAKKIDQVKKAIDTMMIVLFFASIVITAVGIIFSEAIFRAIDLPDEILPLAKTYFNIIMLGNVGAFGFNGTNAILRGMGDSKTPLYFLIISTLINIGLDLLFVLVFNWGIEGIALATIIAQAGAFLTATIYLNRTHKLIRISFINLVFDKGIFLKGLKIGTPSGLQQMFVALGMLALFSIVNRFGTNVIAAYSVATRIDSFAMMPAMNFAMALTAFVGQNMGANRQDRVRKGMIETWKMTSIISLIFTAVSILWGKELMSWFTPDENVIRIGAEYLLIVSIFYVSFSTMFSINAVFRGSGDTLIPMFITLLALWAIRVPFSYVFSMDITINSLFDWVSVPVSKTGIWWGIPVAWIFGMTCSFFYYLSGKWKTKVIVN